ncbi:hypothetical protein [Kineococcus glutinatus]|uniref:Uncharacterized protein n=1 Tax=Kineococcus glutinatus TaxID=1070872 RepID=A0ABP9I560_9ACTN
MRKRVVLGVAAATAALCCAAGATAVLAGGEADVPPASAAARTSFPGLVPAAGEPTLASLATTRPAPGGVVQASGPFDDRFRFDDLTFDGAAVHGRATVTSDVSELLEFQAQAGFYDAEGRLLGTASYVHHLGEHTHDEAASAGEHPEEGEEFTIAVPEQFRATAVAAAIGVPVLVNE